jgi:hypothetical protein
VAAVQPPAPPVPRLAVPPPPAAAPPPAPVAAVPPPAPPVPRVAAAPPKVLPVAEEPFPVAEPGPEPFEFLPATAARPAPRTGAPLPDYPQLGPVRVELRGKGAWAGAGILLALCPVFLFFAAINADQRKPGLVTLFLVLAVVTVLLACWPAVESLRRLGRRVWVCQNGLAWKGGRSRGALTWPEIAAVVYEHHVPKLTVAFGLLGALAARFLASGRIALTTRAGEVVELPAGVRGLYRVASAIAEGIKPHVLPGVEQALAAGQPTPFGPHLLLETPGLKWVDKRVRWEDLDRLVIQYRAASPSVLHADAGRPLLDIELGAIANLHLLLEVAERRFRVRVSTVGEDRLP